MTSSVAYTWLALVVAGSAWGCGTKPAPKASSQAAEPAAETDGEDASMEFEELEIPSDPRAEPVEAATRTIEAELLEARAGLDADRTRLAQERAEFDADKDELDRRLEGIASLEKRIDELMGVGEVARRRRNERIAALGKLISAMPPQAGADMVAQMPDDDAQAILLAISAQNERKASKLLSAMPGERAAALGQLYLNRDPGRATAEPNNVSMPASVAPPATSETPPPDPATPPVEAEG